MRGGGLAGAVGPQQGDDLGRGAEGERGTDDGVAWLHALGHEDEGECIGTGRAGDAKARAGEFSEAALQPGDLGAHDVAAVGEHALDSRLDLWRDAALLRGEIDEIDLVSCRGAHAGASSRLPLASRR